MPATMADTGNDSARRAAEQVACDSYGRLIAFLAARTRDLAGAEDALAEAFAIALKRWPADGVPHNPAAWLLTAARRRQTDALRRRRTQASGEEHLIMIADEIAAGADNPAEIPDRRLALMFACAHPAVDHAMRAPLILQTILGLTAQDIASAFLVAPNTMGQRLARAKNRLKSAGIPFSMPEQPDLPARRDAVLDAIYAAYGKGWAEIGEAGGPALAEEAIWLAHLVVRLLPDDPEPRGLLALMLYTEARRPARRDAAGRFVPLDSQDTALWDRSLLDLAETALARASADGPTGRFQLEAAIQSAHVARRLSGHDTWPAVVALYDHLLALTASPVVALNRAVALAERDGAAAGLAAIAPLAGDLDQYQPYWAARGHLLAQAGRREEAHQALTLAIGLSTDPAIRAYLATRQANLRDG